MKKFLIATIALLITASLFADVKIDPKHRIANRGAGYCCWCCLETLGRNQGITQLINLTDNRANDPDYVETQLVQVGPNSYIQYQTVIAKNFGSVGAVKQKLEALNVKYKMTHWDREHLAESVDKKGCVVFMRDNPLMKGAHAVILVKYDDKVFKYIDPNTQTYWTGEREWFDSYWDGVAISLEK